MSRRFSAGFGAEPAGLKGLLSEQSRYKPQSGSGFLRMTRGSGSDIVFAQTGS